MTIKLAPALLVLLLCLPLAITVRAEGELEPAAVQSLAQQVSANVAALQVMDKRIDTAPAQDRDALIYRRDDRSLKLLVQLESLARSTAALAAHDAVRQQVEPGVIRDLQGAGTAVLLRIGELGERITALQGELASASGTQLVVTEAFIESLETLRFKYYQALVAVIDSRAALGSSKGTLTASLLPMLYLHGETMVGRLEYTGGALAELQERQGQDSGNAELATAVGEMARQQELDLQHLQSLIELLEHLGEDAAEYQAVALQQGQGISIAALDRSVVKRLAGDAWQATRQLVVEEAPDTLFKLLIFIFIILVSRALSRATKRAIRAACERPGVDMSTLLKDVLISVCGGTVTAVGFLVALSQVGISLGPMLAGLGVAGFVVGFALQDTLGNFAAGGMILIYRPYDVDDFVEVVGASGLVKKMSLVSTTITTFDNQTLVVPNSKIWGDVIKNVTAQKLRRVDLVFGIGYSDDIEHAEQVLHSVLEEHDKVLSKPDAMVKLQELADSSVNFVVRPWVKTEDYWDVYWDITREVKLRFDREGISIPFPQRDMHLIQENS